MVQRTHGDCAGAALAMVLRVSWEEAAAAFGRPEARDWSTGVQLIEIEAAALALGTPLRRLGRDQYDPGTSAGLVTIGALDGWHVAVLWYGLLFETDGSVWLLDEYLAAQDPEVTWLGSILVRDRRQPEV